MFLIFLDHFNVLMSKIIFLKFFIILLYFEIKNILKNYRYHTLEHPFHVYSRGPILKHYLVLHSKQELSKI
jgi:hypothetical protein